MRALGRVLPLRCVTPCLGGFLRCHQFCTDYYNANAEPCSEHITGHHHDNVSDPAGNQRLKPLSTRLFDQNLDSQKKLFLTAHKFLYKNVF